MMELVILFFASSCCNTLPRVTSGQATEIERTTAKCGGVVEDDGGGSCDCSERGVCWSTNPSPTITDSRTSDGVGIGSFTSNLTQLTTNTLYHVRAYATNAQGTSYGTEITFTTKDITLPALETSPVTSITKTTAVSGGTNIDDGGSPIIAKGVCWGKTENPDLTNKTNDGAGSETFTSNITELQPGTSYFVRAYATNSKGTNYGLNKPFTTICASPAATTNLPSAVSTISATLNGTVNANGNNCSTVVVFEYGTTTSYGSTITATPGTVTGTTNTAVSATITGLTPGQTYHYRVKATNVGGITYGADQSITPCQAPSATTNLASGLGITAATLNGTVIANNSSTTVTFEYGLTTSYGTTITATPGSVTGSSNTPVIGNITGLTPCTTYHYRIKAVNCGGTVYGSDQTFTTSGTPPSASTSTATPVSPTTATLNGSVNPNNSSTTVTFEYGPTASYGSTVTATPSPVSGSSNTSVNANISGLTGCKFYHYRIKAINCGGTTYGSDMSFTTSGNAPTATTYSPLSIGANSAILSGLVSVNNTLTTVTFEYGKTSSLGSTIAASQSPVTNSIAVSNTITGLTAYADYYYRVKAVNCGGSYNGSIVKIRTDFAKLHDPVLIRQFNTSAGDHNMHITSDGNYYYTCNGGFVSSGKIIKYTLNGVFVASYNIGIDMRSIMYNKEDNYLYVSGFTSTAERNIYKITNIQTGAFTKVFTNMYDNYQSGVALSDDGKYFFAFNKGTLKKYKSTTGSLVTTLTGLNYGTSGYCDAVVAVDPDYIYTWNAVSKIVYVYNHSGTLIRSLTLPNGDFGYSLSFVDGYLFVAIDGISAVGTWYGYNIRRDLTKGEEIISDPTTSIKESGRVLDINDTTNK